MPREKYSDFAILRRLPPWMRGPWQDKLATAIFGPFDMLWEGALEALKSGFVQHCPDDAVEFHARERKLEPKEGETIAALRQRAYEAWTFWSTLGPSLNLIAAINFYIGFTAQLWGFTNSGSWYLGYTGGHSDDDDTANWSRHFMVVGLGSHPWARPVVGPGLVVGPELLVGIDMTTTELSRIRRIYRKHRPAHMVGGDLYVLFDATLPVNVAVVDHNASSDFVKLPLHVQMVGYEHHGMFVGPSMIVGQTFV